MRRFVSLLSLVVLISTSGLSIAGKVKVWQHSAANHYEKAQFQQAVVTNEGSLRLARQLKPLPGIEANQIWDVIEDKDGNLFVATGGEGKLFRVTEDGKATVVFTSEDGQVLCLVAAPDGGVYAGTGPSGHVIKVDGKGVAKVLCDLPESYIWSLVVDAKTQTLYAGTGPKGRVYKVTPDGKSNIFYSTKQEHIHCLALAGDGTLYAGTDKSGLIYKIDPRGKGFVLFSAPQAEVRSLTVSSDGIVYAGTSTPTKRRPGGGVLTSGSSGTPATVLPVSTGGKPERVSEGAAITTPAPSTSDTKESTKSISTPAPSSPSAGENSLYRIAPDGTVREIFREKAMLLSLLRVGGGNKPVRFFVGTGMDGQLFEIDEATKERSEIARLDHGQVLSLCQRRDGSIVLGAGDPGKLYVLQDKFVARGSVVSDVLDAKMHSKWGALRWKGETPANATITIAVRSGNLAEPDETWSDWSAEQTDPQTAFINAPAARFLQYRVTMTSDNADESPIFQGLTLRYQTTNQAPEVGKIEAPDLDAGNLDDPKKIKFKWTGTDANEDELVYNLLVRKEGWKHWVLVEEGFAKTEYEWDTTTAPSGVYELKIVASDRKENPVEDALTGEKVSSPFVVSHLPPAVTLKVAGAEGDQAVIEASATDPLVRLVSGTFAVNGKKWVNVFPTDGLFDSKSETFKFKTESLKPGTYVLVLRVKDAAGNIGAADVVFTVQPKTR